MSDEPTPGPALDARVAEQVMGWEYHDLGEGGRNWLCPQPYHWHTAPPPYSTDIAAAWQVVEQLAKAPYHIGVIVGTLGIPHAKCYQKTVLVAEAWIPLNGLPDSRSLTERCALAICRAALAAVQSEAGHE